jgi:leucyl aminopeptidase
MKTKHTLKQQFNKIKKSNLNMNIYTSSRINHKLGYTIIPILITNLDKSHLTKIINKYINIDNKYNSILEHIEENILNKNVNVASLTIDDKDNKDNNYSRGTNKIPFKNIHQIFIIIINNKTFNKQNNNELMESCRVCGNTLYNIIKSNNISSFNIIDTIDKTSKYLETILEGVLLSSYRFNKYKTDQALNKTNNKFYLHHINLVIPEYNQSNLIKTQIIKLSNIIKSVFIARDLINEPATTAKSNSFITTIKNFISQNKLPIILEILNKQQLEKIGMGLILGVGKGSTPENAPKVLIMRYISNNCSKINDDPAYILLGKGITFDTGGLDLKSGKSMIEMKTDLSGAATVCSFLLGYAMNSGNKCITCICPFAENSIGPDAVKPSDVLTSYDGKTVEITNTDAEGRLILADCLAYIVDKYPKALIIDFATLTGQQEAISSKMFSNILSVNSEKEVMKMIKCGEEINELLVPLPIMENYKNKLESYVADIKNVSFTTSADIIMSSLFMRQFIKKNTKWIHIDIAGQSYKVNDVIKYASPEASGIGVRLLFSYFED